MNVGAVKVQNIQVEDKEVCDKLAYHIRLHYS